MCAGTDNLKECKGDSTIFKCINCENYNKHNPTSEISVAHSALGRNCPSLQAVLEKILNGRPAESIRQAKVQTGLIKNKT